MTERRESVALGVVGVISHRPSQFLIADTFEILCAWVTKVDLTFTVTSI